VAVTPRTAGGLIKCRPVRAGSRIALVAPASPFARSEFDAGVAEIRRLGWEPVFDERIFDRDRFVAGTAATRASALRDAWTRGDVDAILAVRGGYGSVHVLSLLEASEIRASRTAFVGYSDTTSLHVYLGCQVGVVSVHGPMIDGRLAHGEAAYDLASFRRTLSTVPPGELAPDGVEIIRAGEASGPLFGGTLTQLLASLSTPFEFRPPAGHVLFLDDVGERPYRLDRMLTQLRLSGRLRLANAVVFGQLPRCDEPGGAITARDVVRDFAAGFPGPVLLGFPSGHTTAPMLTLPLGVHARVVATGRPRLVIDEAAVEA
jgi:muramoyltetrapeptide carboxypeptidase